MRHDKFDWSGYFEWLVDLVDDGEHDDMLPVLSYLWKKEFDYSNLKPLDKNRASDGIALREHYAENYNCKITRADLEEPCSVLECLVRLSIDIEAHVTGIPGEERPDIWFWKFSKTSGSTNGVKEEDTTKDIWTNALTLGWTVIFLSMVVAALFGVRIQMSI